MSLLCLPNPPERGGAAGIYININIDACIFKIHVFYLRISLAQEWNEKKIKQAPASGWKKIPALSRRQPTSSQMYHKTRLACAQTTSGKSILPIRISKNHDEQAVPKERLHQKYDSRNKTDCRN